MPRTEVLHRSVNLVFCTAFAGALAVGAAGPTVSHAASADSPCPSNALATLTNISRPIVPIGVTVIRGFTLVGTTDATFTNVRLSASSEYAAQQVSATKAYGLRLNAPQGGSFAVQGTWTETYDAGNGVLETCAGTGASTLNATKGSPLVVAPPKAVKFPPSSHIKGTQYDTPATWTWRCSADSDATPLLVTVRWEVDPRPPPAFSKGGNAPFTFSKQAKAFTLTAGDSCDLRQAGIIEARLPQNAKLKVVAGGNVSSGGGTLIVLLRGGFRRTGNVIRGPEPLHLGITLAQGARTLVDTKICSWNQTGFVLASGSGVSCWW
jgi:hypothetical protein